ncbi:hypothetical protein BDV19DRAFT_327487 [Aspergillus venezuelensis]
MRSYLQMSLVLIWTIDCVGFVKPGFPLTTEALLGITPRRHCRSIFTTNLQYLPTYLGTPLSRIKSRETSTRLVREVSWRNENTEGHKRKHVTLHTDTAPRKVSPIRTNLPT